MYKRKLHPNFHQGAPSLLFFFLLFFFSLSFSFHLPLSFHRILLPSRVITFVPPSRLPLAHRCIESVLLATLLYEEESTPFVGVSSISGARYEKSPFRWRVSGQRERERVVTRGEYKSNTRDLDTNAWFVLPLFFFFLFYFEFW